MDQDQNRRTLDAQRTVDAKITLNEAQLRTLRTVENFGWMLRFVRQPLFLEPIPVVYSPQGKAFAIIVIEEDGKLNTDIDIQLREEQYVSK